MLLSTATPEGFLLLSTATSEGIVFQGTKSGGFPLTSAQVCYTDPYKTPVINGTPRRETLARHRCHAHACRGHVSGCCRRANPTILRKKYKAATVGRAPRYQNPFPASLAATNGRGFITHSQRRTARLDCRELSGKPVNSGLFLLKVSHLMCYHNEVVNRYPKSRPRGRYPQGPVAFGCFARAYGPVSFLGVPDGSPVPRCDAG